MEEPAKEYTYKLQEFNRVKIQSGDTSKELFIKQHGAERDMINLLSVYSKEGWKPVSFENSLNGEYSYLFREGVSHLYPEIRF